MHKSEDRRFSDDLNDLSFIEDTDKVTQRYFNIKIKDKNYTPIDNSINSKKVQIYEILKKRLLKPRDYILSRNNYNPLFNTAKTKKIKKDVKFSKLYEKIDFGSLDYLQTYTSTDNAKKNRETFQYKLLLNSQNFNFHTGFEWIRKQKETKIKNYSKEIKNYHNKTALRTFGLKKHQKKDNNIINAKKSIELNKNYYNTKTFKLLIDNSDNNTFTKNNTNNNINTNSNNNTNNNIDKNSLKKISKDLSINSESMTSKNNTFYNNSNYKLDKNNNKYKKIKINSENKKCYRIGKEISASQNSNSETSDDKKNIMGNDKNNNKINLTKKSSLKTLIVNCINDNNVTEKPKSFSVRKTKKRLTTKYDINFKKSFISQNNKKLLKGFQKFADLIDKENDDNVIHDTNTHRKNMNDIFAKIKKLEKEKFIKENFYKYGSKSISSLLSGINSDQVYLNNKLFKIIDRTNKKIKKEKKLDEVLEIILDRKFIKKKRIKAKEIYIDASDGRKLMEERNRLRFMMRFADLIKNMKDEIALNYTKNLIDKNSRLKNEFNLADLTEYKKIKEERYKEHQKMIRDRLMRKIVEIEGKIKLSEIEKDNLYNKYEIIFKKNNELNDEQINYNIYKMNKGEKKYHNIDLILNNFHKIVNE